MAHVQITMSQLHVNEMQVSLHVGHIEILQHRQTV